MLKLKIAMSLRWWQNSQKIGSDAGRFVAFLSRVA
jgi:hypothetical protein